MNAEKMTKKLKVFNILNYSLFQSKYLIYIKIMNYFMDLLVQYYLDYVNILKQIMVVSKAID
jgi:hypothetical protein